MSFNGQSNTPWQRMSAFHQNTGQNGMFLQQQQQQHVSAAFVPSGLFPTNTGGGAISYPQQRSTGLNPVAFQPGTGGQQQQQQQQQQYNSIGTVTKINNECGLVNDEIFFYRNACKGIAPKLGDRVIFEAIFSTTGQFKWNATRIQLMGNMSQSSQPPPLMGSGGSKSSVYTAVPPPHEYQRAQQQQQRHNSPRRSPIRSDRRHVKSDRDRRDYDRNHRSRERDEEERDRKRRREDHDRSREHNVATSRGHDKDRDREDSKRDHSTEHRERERERERERDRERDRAERSDRSPPRPGVKGRRARTIRRYMIQIPKYVLSYKIADIQELRRRYSNLYIPSDFFHANIKWSSVFTPDKPFTLRRPCQFHIMHRIVDSPFDQSPELLDPPDADYIYSAKVMLMACPPIAEIYQKCFEDDGDNEQNTVHPSRLISFLVGTRGRNEPMAIGGAWSPSLDGEDPDKDPAVLIRTAIRTCKALTGIDLSNCTQWYRFVEFYYHRTDYKKKDKDAAPRIETVVIYLPDVHSCLPNATQWQNLTQVYKNAVDNIIVQRSGATKGTTSTAESSGVKSDEAGADGVGNTSEGDNLALDDDVISTKQLDSEKSVTNIAPSTTTADIDTRMVEEDEKDDNNENKKVGLPADTPVSQLDLKSMKVPEIRKELIARKLSSKGPRNEIVARLAKALKKESVAKNNEIAKAETKENENKAQQEEKNMEIENAEVVSESEIQKDEESEEQEDWADVIDVDMSDIVILDEYDSSKIPEENTTELSEKEKNQLIRRYTLPDAEHIVVHPSKTAKGGKFDCSIMSLSVLLDYGPEDAKERFFEVSLFAELFNEMLMRDFAFNIYKDIYCYKDNDDKCTTTEEGTNNNNKDATVDDDETTTTKIEVKSHESNDKAINERRPLKRTDDDPDEGTQSHRKNKSSARTSREKDNNVEKKMIVVKPQLLLSYIYFDTSHCGYIFEKDLEELFSIIGLNLSRGQIRKLLGSLSIRQALYYRKFTDKEECIENISSLESMDEICSDELNNVALGNNKFASIYNSNQDIATELVGTKEANENDGLVTYNGVVVHVGKLLEQIRSTENNFSNLEKIYNDLKKQHTDLQREHTKFNTKIKDLQSEVKSLNRKLSDADQDLFSLNRKYRDQHSALSYVYNRVSPFFNREKEKDYKNENLREKDTDLKDKESKEKGKEKDLKKKEKSKESAKEDGKLTNKTEENAKESEDSSNSKNNHEPETNSPAENQDDTN